MGHIKMMGAAQPFLSGAISKTVNLPQDCSVDDIAEAYLEAWRQGIKAVAIYRDNSKGTQPLNVSAQTDDNKKGTKALNKMDGSDAKAVSPAAAGTIEIEEAVAAAKAAAANQITTLETQLLTLTQQLAQIQAAATQNSDAVDSQAPPRAVRHRLPAERASVTHKFSLSGHEGYITVGLYPNGSPGEIFIRMAKEGSTVSGLMDSFATAVSLALQHGVPLRVLCEKFAHTRFEPSGWTGNPEIGFAKSIMDYIFRWIQIRFLSGTQLDLFAGLKPQVSVPVEGTVSAPTNRVDLHTQASFPVNEASFHAPDAAANLYDRTAPQSGIAPDLSARSGLATENGQRTTENSFEDRGIYHTADAMRSMIDMGDSPSCATCGAIMTRNGSCYRCMECGSTSGCS
jgi:ribonucleoside-diphosphate reductase alpha chain